MGYVGGGGRAGDTKENGTLREGVAWQGRTEIGIREEGKGDLKGKGWGGEGMGEGREGKVKGRR
jgi:hypothetical protein